MTSHLWNCNFFWLCNLLNVLGKNGSYIEIKTFFPPYGCSISWKTENVKKQIECVTDTEAMICDIFCDVTTQIDLSPIDPKIYLKIKYLIKLILTKKKFRWPLFSRGGANLSGRATKKRHFFKRPLWDGCSEYAARMWVDYIKLRHFNIGWFILNYIVV